MALNPWWVPVDGIGHRVCVDPKTKRLKRDVTANATAVVASSAGGAAARSSSSHALVGESARREFCKPIQSHAAEFERLASLGIGFDPNTRYVMDAPKARIARSYISGTSSGSGVVVEVSSFQIARPRLISEMFRRRSATTTTRTSRAGRATQCSGGAWGSSTPTARSPGRQSRALSKRRARVGSCTFSEL